MSRYIVHTLFIAGVFYSLPYLPYLEDHFAIYSFSTAIFAAIVFGFINAFVRPVLFAITLPFTIMTFGLFSFVLNILCFYFVTFLVSGLATPTLVGAIVASAVLAIANCLVHSAVHNN